MSDDSERGVWTEDMASVTHLIPGADEEVARAMLLAAIRFFEEKPELVQMEKDGSLQPTLGADAPEEMPTPRELKETAATADPQFAGFQGSAEHNEDGKALTLAMMAVPGATETLYNTVVPHVLLLWQFLAANRDAEPEKKVDFWDAYVTHSRQANGAIERRRQRKADSARIRAEILSDPAAGRAQE